MTEKERLERMNQECQGTLVEHLGIVFTGAGDDWLEATMPIDNRTMRPGNLLHGGAIMALTETVGSGLTYMGVDTDKYHVYGIEINGNHIHKAEGKYVVARAEFVHRGRRTQVVNVVIRDEFGRLASVCRITNIVMEKK